MLKLLALAAVSFLGSCVSPQLTRLPMYDECARVPASGETRYLRTAEVSSDGLPALIPYAMISIRGANTEEMCEASVERLSEKENPDVLYMGTPGTTYAGSMGSAAASGGVAVGWSAPVYGFDLEAYCYRLSPVQLGVDCDGDGMVVAVRDESRKSGIIEGDHLVSLDGLPIKYGKDFSKSPHLRKLLKLKPGDEVTLVWIRPGTGRMEGKLTCLENPPIHLSLPDAREEREALHQERQGRGAARRSQSDF